MTAYIYKDFIRFYTFNYCLDHGRLMNLIII